MSETDVAVVGGGMFGVTAAVELGEAGFDVTLFEKQKDILGGASGHNHWRLHRGYHYPRSDETAEGTYTTEPLFRDRYEDAVVEDDDHYYAIAESSWVDFSEYEVFLRRHELEYDVVDADFVNRENVEKLLRVRENHVDVERLRELCRDELDAADVTVALDTEVASVDELDDYDYVVIATYAHSNSLLPEGHPLRREFTFEVCEIPMIELPAEYLGKNIIVVYGPFMSVDPWGDTNRFLMGDYHHMRHHSTTGYEPEIPDAYADLINDGLVDAPDVSTFSEFREHGQQYIPGVAESTYHGSFFTIRTILPDVGETDARPTLVQSEGNVVTVFGGKLATSVQTGREVADRVTSLVT